LCAVITPALEICQSRTKGFTNLDFLSPLCVLVRINEASGSFAEKLFGGMFWKGTEDQGRELAQTTYIDIRNLWVDIPHNPLQLFAWYLTIQGNDKRRLLRRQAGAEVCSRGGRRAIEIVPWNYSYLLIAQFRAMASFPGAPACFGELRL
jgi:hypothetical protein